VRDVALAHLLAAQFGKASCRYIFGGENLAFPEILEMLARVARYRPRWAPQLSPGVLHLVAVAAETRSRWTGREPYPSMGHVQLNRMYWYCRSDRARSELGFEPRSVIASLEAAYAWHSGRVSLTLGRFARWWMRHAAAA
jgi:dihydroflavonol-4-reductase